MTFRGLIFSKVVSLEVLYYLNVVGASRVMGYSVTTGGRFLCVWVVKDVFYFKIHELLDSLRAPFYYFLKLSLKL